MLEVIFGSGLLIVGVLFLVLLAIGVFYEEV